MNDAEQLQALLLLRDKDLVRLIDRCVLQRRVEIPPNELRSARLGQPRLGNRDRACELSALGLRAKPRLALAALHSVIWDSYERTGLMDELGWKLRRRPGIPPRGALMDYIRASDPRETIRELIISSMPVTKAVADSLEFALEGTDAAGPFTDRLLWKLGFDPKTYHEDYVRLRRRLEEFNETVLRLGEARTEDEREKIRAVGVNVFVSVEHFLQDLVSYNVWLLSSDHFLDTRFTYERKIAIAAVPSALGQKVVSGNKEFPWSMEGANALGTLLVFCQGLSEWVRELLTRDPASLARPAEDLPHFADDPERVFAFRHTALWADADPTEFQQYAKGLESILNQVSRADSAAVRNGLDHRRDDREFPSGDAMLACAARLRDALEVADLQRYIPKEFWLQSLTRDRYGQESFIFTDYQGREITLGGPAVVSGLPKPRFRTPVVIAPGNLLGQPNSELRFEIREVSAYSQYWKGYPRRRKIPSPPATLHEDQTLSGTD